jgi:hypothetical protein
MLSLYDRTTATGPNTDVDARADILVYFPDNPKLVIDTTVTSVHTGSTVRCKAAQVATNRKLTLYKKYFRIDERELIILAMEHTGHLTRQARDMIRGIARRVVNKTGIAGEYGDRHRWRVQPCTSKSPSPSRRAMQQC